MFPLYHLVVVVSVVASITVSVNASAATDALKQRLGETEKELENIKSENVKLAGDIEIVEKQIESLQKDYNSAKESVNEKNAKVAADLKLLAFETLQLQILVKEKNDTANYLKALSESIAFSRLISKQDVELVKTRRENGVEEMCLNYKARDKKTPSSSTKLSRVSTRSTTNDDTADIVLISGQIEVAESNVFAAKEEREQLKYTLNQKKDLLAFKDKSWKAEIDNKYKTLKSNEEKVVELTKVVNNLKYVDKSLDKLINTLKDNIAKDRLAWKKNQKQLSTTYKKALTCYKDTVPKTQAEISNYSAFLRRGKNPKSS